MPIYSFKCDKCNDLKDVFKSIKEFDNDIPICCNKNMQRVIFAPMVMNDMEPYMSMATGEWITSRSRHKEHLKQHNCIEIGNETKYLKQSAMAPPPGLKETLIQVANDKLK